MELDPIQKQAEELKRKLEQESAGSGATFEIRVEKAGVNEGQLSIVKEKVSGEQIVFPVPEGGDQSGKNTTVK